MQITRQIEIAVPPDTVWPIMSDVERWHEWTASIRSIERLDAGPFALGSRARGRQPRLPVAVWRVTALDPGRSFTWESASPVYRVVATHTVEPAATGSLVTLELRSSGVLAPLFDAMFGSISRRYVEMEATGLKRRAESARTT